MSSFFLGWNLFCSWNNFTIIFTSCSSWNGWYVFEFDTIDVILLEELVLKFSYILIDLIRMIIMLCQILKGMLEEEEEEAQEAEETVISDLTDGEEDVEVKSQVN